MQINFLDPTIKIKNFYSYRSNRCRYSLLIDNVPFNIVKDYIEKQGYTMDNYISWENEKGLCFTYSDHALFIGNEMLNISW